ncbi:Ig-like domain-containing protein [Pantoea agglomerans]
MTHQFKVNIFASDNSQQTQLIDFSNSFISQRINIRSSTHKVAFDQQQNDVFFHRAGPHLHISNTPVNLNNPPLIMENFYNHLPQLVQNTQEGHEIPYQVELSSGNFPVSSFELGQSGKSTVTTKNLLLNDVKPTIESVFDNVGSTTGSISRGEVTDDARPIVSGKAEPGSLVTIYSNGIPWAYGYANDQGVYAIESTTPLFNGNNQLTVTSSKDGVVDTGNDSFNFELRAPAERPVIEMVWDSVGDTGFLEQNGITDDHRPELRGVAMPNSTLEIFSNLNGPIGTVKVDANGEWSFEPELDLAEGNQYFTVVQLQESGRQEVSNTFLVTIRPGNIIPPIETPVEPIIPVVPPIESMTPCIHGVYDNFGPERGMVSSGDVIDDSQPKFHGLGEPDSFITIRIDGEVIASVKVNSWGAWEFTPGEALSFGEHRVTASALDSTGLENSISEDFILTIEDKSKLPQLPDMPSVTTVIDDVGDEKGVVLHGGSTDDNHPGFSGHGIPNSTLFIFDCGRYIAEVNVDAHGNWQYVQPAEMPMDRGWHSISVAQLDHQGVMGSLSPAINFYVNSTYAPPVVTPVEPEPEIPTPVEPIPEEPLPVEPPPVLPPVQITTPVITGVFDDEKSFAVGNGEMTTDKSPIFSGTADPFALVAITAYGIPVGMAEADAQGNWSCEVKVNNMGGNIEFKAIAVLDNNFSDASESWSLILGYDSFSSLQYSNLLSGADDLLLTVAAEMEKAELLNENDVRIALSDNVSSENGMFNVDSILPSVAIDEDLTLNQMQVI